MSQASNYAEAVELVRELEEAIRSAEAGELEWQKESDSDVSRKTKLLINLAKMEIMQLRERFNLWSGDNQFPGDCKDERIYIHGVGQVLVPGKFLQGRNLKSFGKMSERQKSIARAIKRIDHAATIRQNGNDVGIGNYRAYVCAAQTVIESRLYNFRNETITGSDGEKTWIDF